MTGARSETDPVIVIFGCAVRRGGVPSAMLRDRIEAAARLGRSLSGTPLYIPTGGVGRHPPSEAAVMAHVLIHEFAVRPAQIQREEAARDTLMSARAIARMLAKHTGAVYVVSSGFHQPRCVALLRMAGLDARFSPPPPPAVGLGRRWYWRLREGLALPYDTLQMGALRIARKL